MWDYQTSFPQMQLSMPFINHSIDQNIGNGNPSSIKNVNTPGNMLKNSGHPLSTVTTPRSPNDIRLGANYSSSGQTVHHNSLSTPILNTSATSSNFQPLALTGNYHSTQPQLRNPQTNRTLSHEHLHIGEHPPQIIPLNRPPHSSTFNRSTSTILHSDSGNNHRPSSDNKAIFDRNIKIANAFSSAFMGVKNRCSGHIEDSWPQKAIV